MGKVLLPKNHIDSNQLKSFVKAVSEGKVQMNFIGSFAVKQGKDTIYMVASMQDKGENPRTWGFVMSEKEARDAVTSNAGDMWENGYYQYTVIEKLWSGIFCTHSEIIGWYKWVGKDYKKGGWKPVKTPKWSKGFYNWTL